MSSTPKKPPKPTKASSKVIGQLTVEQIQEDRITQLASQLWSPAALKNEAPFQPQIIEEIYRKEIVATRFSTKRIMMLEFSQYLENYLWPNYDPEKASDAHRLSIVLIINEKFREKVPLWNCFKKNPDNFPGFFQGLLRMTLEKVRTHREQSYLIVFLIHCFTSLEMDLIREQVQRLVSLPIWTCLIQGKREELFKANPKYKKFYNFILKKDAKLSSSELEKVQFERSYLWNLLQRYTEVLKSVKKKAKVEDEKLLYCERFMEFLIDIEAQLPTRRFFNAVLHDSHIVCVSYLSNLVKKPEGKLFKELLDILKMYAEFEIDETTGEALNIHNRIDLHYNRMLALQKSVFKLFKEDPDLKKFAISNIGSVDSRDVLMKYFGTLGTTELHQILSQLNMLPVLEEGQQSKLDKEFLLELLIGHHEKKRSQQEQINEMPLYPTEDIIWDENIVPSEYYNGEGTLALPKINLQFLTLHDYLLRNFNLFRLESTYEIRQDIEDAVSHLKPWKAEDGSTYFGGWARMAQPIAGFNVVEIRQDIEDALSHLKPWKAEDGSTYFGGWARMAQPIAGFNVVEVAKPRIGENHPAQVRADVTVTLSVVPSIKAEWEGLRKHDVAFLITVRPPNAIGTKYDPYSPFIPQVGLCYVRGCEIEGMLDNEGKVIEEGPEPKPEMHGDTRTFRVWIDPNQYQLDMSATEDGSEDVYETFNIIMRRKPKENNFKAVLETIRTLMNTECVVPDWLHDLILGYGSPDAAHYTQMDNKLPKLDWNDTFINIDHLKSSFPEHEVEVTTEEFEKHKPPFKLQFHEEKSETGKRKEGEEEPTAVKKVMVEPHVIPNRGPYSYSEPKRNGILFTPTQIEAIRAGMQPGLTMVVGPPGTGKTDVAVQIISNIYHNFPDQRTIIVTHSNQALNQLFEKIMALDIDERHLLRLGHGEEALETEKDFSRYGRVNYVLAQRLEILEEVSRLQNSLDCPGDLSYTCETAGYFFLYQVLARWEKFLSKIRKLKEKKVEKIKEFFPFTKFFENAPQPMFKCRNFTEDMSIAEGCFRHIKKMFTQLEEFRAFELLRSGSDRADYLLIKEAKIIAMTCTHAALKRQDLVDVDFKFDNIMMEESAQILEIETFIPLLLQNPQDNNNRLKRWIMIGDHHQLPPVIKNMAFQKFSNMEQSLFTRLVRLGVPTVDLDAQGRARASIASLYSWRYKKLGNLPHVSTNPEYHFSNSGFVFDYQLINVENFNGVGESEPNPYFYQNLGEAEYVVAMFMYMRLLGYPAEKISILTTYNGQKHLIRDVVNQRCAKNQFIGRPHTVTTVDRYQGQQNDYILLSLVRTRTVGHLRDVRRLVVALSRARLGLYVFARVSLFSNCFELTPAFNRLLQRPTELHIDPTDTYPTKRKADQPPLNKPIIIRDMPHMADFVYNLYNQKVDLLMKQQSLPSSESLQEPPRQTKTYR